MAISYKIGGDAGIGGLTDRQKKFCLFYLQDFNARRSAKRAGFKENYGYVLLKNHLIKKEIDRLREEMMGELFVSGRDVLELYIRIAFADITDYVEFGNYDAGDQKSSYVYLKDCQQVDGQLIEEVSVSSTGGKIKLLDKTKALEKLEKFFDLFGIDAWKKFVEEQKLNVRENGTNRVINVITGIIRGDEDEI